MLFPDPNVLRCIMEEHMENALRKTEKARLLREGKGTEAANRGAFASLLAGMQNLLLSVRLTKRSPSHTRKDTPLGAVQPKRRTA